MNNTSFNGETKDYIQVLRVNRSIWSSRKHNISTVPGRKGGVYQDTEVDPRYIPAEILIEADTQEDLFRRYEEVAEWFDVDEPKPLVFENDPSRTYYAMVEGELTPDEIVTFARVNVTFFCPDPDKYGERLTRRFTDDQLTINYKGTADTYGIFTLNPTEDITHVDVFNESGQYMRIGEPLPVDQPTAERRTKLFWKEMKTMIGWSTPTSVENGDVTGVMETNGYRFFADSFGSGSGWHGPSKKASLSEPVYDFTATCHIRNFVNSPDQLGRVDVSLLDANSKQIGKMMMAKYKPGTVQNQGRIQAGNEEEHVRFLDTFGDSDSAWKRFDGVMELTRRGNKWEAYIGIVDKVTGRHTSRSYETWEEPYGRFMEPITQVQVYTAQYGNYPVTDMTIDDVKVYRWNDIDDSAMPFSVGPDDEVVFDFNEEDIRINGDSIFEYPERVEQERRRALFSEFFPIKPGINKLYTSPFGKLSAKVDFTERFK